MTISGIRFGHVAFRTADVERSVRWYADAFGAQKVFHALQEGERQELMFLEFARGKCVELFTHGQMKTATGREWLHGSTLHPQIGRLISGKFV